MKSHSALLLVGSVFISTSFLTSLYAQNPGDHVPDRFIVQLQDVDDIKGVAAAHGLNPDGEFKSAAKGFSGVVPAGRLNALRNDARVLSVSPDRVVSANPKGGNGGGGGKPDKPGGDDGGTTDPPARDDEVIPSGVERIGAIPGLSAITGMGVGIAIVDTGLDFNHLDLSTGSVSFKASVKGRRMSTREGSTVGQDDEGHGTHVGGIAAARFDGYDVVGVAPDATLYAVKVLDSSGNGYDSTVIAGLDWIAANAEDLSPPISVVNMSLGRPGTLEDNPTYHQAIQTLHQMGITVVVSAGNDSALEVSENVPSTYPEVLAVASTTALAGDTDIGVTVEADTSSFFSTDGAYDLATGIGVTISAPGAKQEDIAGGYVTSVGILSTRLGGGTERNSGTSMSAPHVAGVAALLQEQYGSLDPESVRALIRSGASGVGSAPYDSPTSGYTFDGEREGVVDVVGTLTP